MPTTPQQPAARDFAAEMGAIRAQAARMAQEQARAQASANEQMLGQSLNAYDTIAAKLGGGGPTYEMRLIKGSKGQPDRYERVQTGTAAANEYTGNARSLLDANRDSLPGMVGYVGRMDALAQQAEGQLGNTDIENRLRAMAESDLAMGRSLSPEQEREAQASARAGFAARGMAVGPASAAAEILNRDKYASLREQERRGFAGNVNQMLVGNSQSRLGTAASLLGQTAAADQNVAGMRQNLAQGYVGLDPYARALGSNLPVATQANSAQMTGQSFGQMMNYGQDVANTNFNAEWSNYLNAQNMNTANRMGQMQMQAAGAAGNSATTGALIGAGGAILGGVAIAF